MAEYNDMIITRQGTDLINRQITGEKSLEITKLAVGTGTYTGEENLEEFEELFHPLENYEIYSAKRKDGAVEIKAVVTNRTFNEDATLTEIGVYATDGTTEILYGIATAMCPLQLPAYNGNFEYSVDFSVYFTVNNGVGLTIRDRTDIATEEIAGVVKASEEIQVESDGIMRITEKPKKELLDKAKEFMEMKISDLIGGAPETLDTLKEIADAIAENETIVDALNEAIGKKIDIKDFNTKISNLNTLIKYTTVVTPNPTIGPQIIQKESEIFDLDGNPEPFPIQEVVAGHELALRQLNTDTSPTSQPYVCGFHIFRIGRMRIICSSNLVDADSVRNTILDYRDRPSIYTVVPAFVCTGGWGTIFGCVGLHTDGRMEVSASASVGGATGSYTDVAKLSFNAVYTV